MHTWCVFPSCSEIERKDRGAHMKNLVNHHKFLKSSVNLCSTKQVTTHNTSQLQPALDFSRHHRELGWGSLGEVDKGIWTFLNCTCHSASANYIGFKPAEYNYPNAAAVANNINFILHWNPLKLLFEMLHNFHFWKISNIAINNYVTQIIPMYIHLLWPCLSRTLTVIITLQFCLQK